MDRVICSRLAALAMLFVASLLASAAASAAEEKLPETKTVGQLEVVATFHGPMPTGVTVSQKGRIFVNYPRWGDAVEFTVAEIRGGKATAYPDATVNRPNEKEPATSFVSVQSVVVDPADRLWLLDTGSIEFGPTSPGGPKLVAIDLATDRVVKRILLPREVALEKTYLNDIRFDLRHGEEGVAYITDSAKDAANAIIVVDLASGKSYRRLHDHPSTKPDKEFRAIVEGQVVMERPENGPPKPISIGADGIAISHDGKHLYYCPLGSRRLYRVPTAALRDAQMSEKDVAAAVEDLGDRGFASDGLESDAQGRIYLTNYEDNAILRRDAEGNYETLVSDPRVMWPDTMSVAADGYLYFTANQLHRQKNYQRGVDKREKPYVLFRTKINGTPVLLR